MGREGGPISKESLLQILRKKQLSKLRKYIELIEKYDPTAEQAVQAVLMQVLVEKKADAATMVCGLMLYKQVLLSAELLYFEEESLFPSAIHDAVAEVCEYKPKEPLKTKSKDYFANKLKEEDRETLTKLSKIFVYLAHELIQNMAKWYPTDYLSPKFPSRYKKYYDQLVQKEVIFPNSGEHYVTLEDEKSFKDNLEKFKKLYDLQDAQADPSQEQPTPMDGKKSTKANALRNEGEQAAVSIDKKEKEPSKKALQNKNIIEVKEVKEVKGVKEVQKVKEVKEVKGVKEVQKVNEAKGVKKAKQVKEIKEVEELKEVKEVKNPNPSMQIQQRRDILPANRTLKRTQPRAQHCLQKKQAQSTLKTPKKMGITVFPIQAKETPSPRQFSKEKETLAEYANTASKQGNYEKAFLCLKSPLQIQHCVSGQITQLNRFSSSWSVPRLQPQLYRSRANSQYVFQVFPSKNNSLAKKKEMSNCAQSMESILSMLTNKRKNRIFTDLAFKPLCQLTKERRVEKANTSRKIVEMFDTLQKCYIPNLPEYFLPVTSNMNALRRNSLILRSRECGGFYRDDLLECKLLKLGRDTYTLILRNISLDRVQLVVSARMFGEEQVAVTKQTKRVTNLHPREQLAVEFQFATKKLDFKFLRAELLVNQLHRAIFLPITLLDQCQISTTPSNQLSAPKTIILTRQTVDLAPVPSFFKTFSSLAITACCEIKLCEQVIEVVVRSNQAGKRSLGVICKSHIEDNFNFAKVMMQLLTFLLYCPAA